MLSQQSLEKIKQEMELGKVSFVPRLPSTNETASEWLQNNCPDRSLIVADHQTRGKGRSGRKWHTNPGSGLAFSLIFTQTQLSPQLYSGLAAVSIVEGLSDIIQAPIQIKWPNDILVDRLKVAGVLNELHWTGDNLSGIVIGIGINIYKSSLDIQDNLRYPATFLQKYASTPLSRTAVLKKLIGRLINNHNPDQWPLLHASWNQNLAFKGQLVKAIRQGNEVIVGKLIRIARSGLIELELADSRYVQYNANEIQTLSPLEESSR